MQQADLEEGGGFRIGIPNEVVFDTVAIAVADAVVDAADFAEQTDMERVRPAIVGGEGMGAGVAQSMDEDACEKVCEKVCN